MMVAGTGGEPTVLTKPDRNQGELDHLFPAALPRGDAVLFTIVRGLSNDDSQIAVLDMKTRRYKTLIRNGSQAEYAGNGFLVYGSGGALRAIRFDPERLETVGESAVVVDQVLTKPFGRVMDFSVSPMGSLVYVPGRFAAAGVVGPPRSLVWVDRKGREQPLNLPARGYAYARLSPDGGRLALDIRDQEQDIWTFDLARETLTRLTVGPALDVSPVWTPDGTRIVYSEAREGGTNLFWQRADGTSPPERLTTSPGNQIPTSISPDGKLVIFHGGGLAAAAQLVGSGNRLMSLQLDGKSQPQPLLKTAFNERNGDISPNGHWLVYDSDQSGRNEVYVRPFPDVTAGLVQVSSGGGERPMWARDGRELFISTPTGFSPALRSRQIRPSAPDAQSKCSRRNILPVG
jgi:serine/threonine-protein kinase